MRLWSNLDRLEDWAERKKASFNREDIRDYIKKENYRALLQDGGLMCWKHHLGEELGCDN